MPVFTNTKKVLIRQNQSYLNGTFYGSYVNEPEQNEEWSTIIMLIFCLSADDAYVTLIKPHPVLLTLVYFSSRKKTLTHEVNFDGVFLPAMRLVLYVYGRLHSNRRPDRPL
jgi:hypothetical protein